MLKNNEGASERQDADSRYWLALRSPAETVTPIEQPVNPVEPKKEDEPSEEDNESAESAEEQESKRLNKEIANNYSADIFAAARAIGKPLEHSRDSYKWSNEDKKRLLEALKNLGNPSNDEGSAATQAGQETTGTGTASATGESEAAGNTGSEAGGGDNGNAAENAGANNGNGAAEAVAAGVAGTVAGAAAAEAANRANGESDNENGDSDEEDAEEELKEAKQEAEEIENSNESESNKAEKRKSLRKKLAKRALIIAGALAMVVGLGSSINAGEDEVIEAPHKIVQESDDDKDTEENKEDNESIHDRSTYHGMFASEDGKTYNSEKAWTYNFGEGLPSGASEQEMKTAFGDRMVQPGQLAATYFYIQDIAKTSDANFGIKEAGRFSNADELLEAMEADADLHQKVYDFVMNFIEKSNVKEDRVTGTFHNFYLDSKFETSDSDTSNIEVVACTTNENGTLVYKYTFTWTDTNKNEHTATFTFKEMCGGQPLAEYDFTHGVRKVTPPDTTPPEKTPPEKTPPEKTPPETPPVTPPVTPPEEEKKPLDQKKVEEGLDGLKVKPEEQKDELEDKKPEMARYNRDKNNDGSTGAERLEDDQKKKGDTQVGSVDIEKTKSADGDGKTIKEVINDAEKKGGADGTDTSEQVSRTPEDAKQKAEDDKGVKAQAEANKAGDEANRKIEQQAKENADKTEAQKQADAAKSFADGDF